MILARLALCLAIVVVVALLLAFGADVIECPEPDGVCAAARTALGEMP